MAVDLNILTAEDARNLLVLLARVTVTGTQEARVIIVLEEKLKRVAVQTEQTDEDDDGENANSTDE